MTNANMLIDAARRRYVALPFPLGIPSAPSSLSARGVRAANASRFPHPPPSVRGLWGQMGFREEAAPATRYTGGGRCYSRRAGTKQCRAAQRRPRRGRRDKGWDLLRKSPRRELAGTGCARARGDYDDASLPRSGPALAKGNRFVVRRLSPYVLASPPCSGPARAEGNRFFVRR